MSASDGWEFQPAKSAFPHLNSKWDALNEELYLSHPLLSSKFVAPLVHHFATDRDVLASVNRGSKANLLLCSRPRPLLWTSFQPAQAQIAPALISDPEIARSLVRQFAGFNIAFELYSQDPLFTPFNKNTVPDASEFTKHALTTSIDLGISFDEYWAGRSSKLRQNINRYIRRAEADGCPARLVTIQDIGELPVALERYGDMESRGWKGEAGTAVHTDNAQGNFYRDVLTAFASDENATIFELYLGDQFAASRIAISSNEMIVMLKTTYAESLSKYAPGRILLYLVLEREFKLRRRKWVEFYTSAAPELITWSTHTRTIEHLTLYRSMLVKSAFNQYRHLKQFIRGSSPGANVDASEDGGVIHPISLGSLHDLPPSGARLLKRAGDSSLFLSQMWFDNLVKHVAAQRGETFCIIAQHTNGKVFGVLPLWLSKESIGLNARVLRSLANYYTALYDVILDVDAVAPELSIPALVDGICRRAPDWDMFTLSPIAEEAKWLPIMVREFENRGMTTSLSTAFVNWYMPLNDVSFESYLTARPSDLRNTIQRRRRKLEREHRISFKLGTTSEGLERMMSDYETIYRVSWKRYEPYPAFIRGIAAFCAEHGWLRLGILYIDDEPAAAQIWIVHNKVASIYKLAFDPRFGVYSAGSILSMQLMEYVIEHDKVTEIDFLTGDDPFKKSWVTHSRRRLCLDVFNPGTPRGRLLGWRRRVGEFMRKEPDRYS